MLLNKSKSLIVLGLFGILGGQELVRASSVWETQPIFNSPGYVSLDRNSSVYSKDSCSTSDDGIDRRTPSCMLAQTYLTRDGRVRVEAIREQVAELVRSRNAVLAEYCQRNLERSENDIRVCERADWYLTRFQCDPGTKQTGLGKLMCKWKSGKLHQAYEAGVAELQRAIGIAEGLAGEAQRFSFASAMNSPEAHRFYEALFQGLEIAESIRSENPFQGQLKGVLEYGYSALFREVKIRDRDENGRALPEAANLVVPQSLRREKGLDPVQAYFSPEELQAKGIDLSALDPETSGLWRKPRGPIASYRTRNYNGQFNAMSPVEMLDPEQPITVYFDKVKGNGKTPKINVAVGEPGSRQKYKLKYKARLKLDLKETRGLIEPVVTLIKDGTEVHTETVINNLANALGFTVSPTFYKRNVRLYFTNDAWTGAPSAEHEKAFAKALSDMLRDIRKHGEELGTDWESKDAFSRVSQDSAGRKYVDLEEASFEADSANPAEIEIGAFAKESLGKMFKREFRAFELFYAWVGDHDTKDKNSDLNVIATGDPERPYKVVYSAADMGAALGSNLSKDRPNLFNARMVKEVRGDEIVLTYRTPFHGALFDRVTKADAKWFLRLAGQLSPSQVREAFLGAGYHPVVAELMTQKMLHRRDDLARALGMDEFRSTSDMRDPDAYKVPGAEQYFDEHGRLARCPEGAEPRHCQIFPPASGKVSDDLKTSYSATATETLLRPVAQEITRIGMTKDFFVDAVKMSAGVTSFLPARYLVPNPDPVSRYPYWLIDVIRVGLGGGVDDVFDASKSLDLGKIKSQVYKIHEFVRVQPVTSQDAPGKVFDGWKLYDPTKYPEKFKSALLGMRSDLVNSLGHGDMLISSAYLVFGTGVTQALVGNPDHAFGVGIMAAAGVEVARVKRVLLTRDNPEDTNSLVGVWETMDSKTLQGEINAKAFVTTFPMFVAQVQQRNQKDRAYRFNLGDDAHVKVLMENLTRALPEIPEDLDVKKIIERDMKVRKRGFLASVFGFLNFWFDKEESEISKPDGTTVVSNRESREKYGLLTLFTKETAIEVESLGIVGESPIAKMSLKYVNRYATRDAFREVYEDYLPKIFKNASDYIRFEPRDTNFYLGTLTLNGSVEFKKEALGEIFAADRDWNSVCRVYATALPLTISFEREKIDENFAQRFCWFLESHYAKREQLDFDLSHQFEWQDAKKIKDAVFASYEFLDSWQSAQKAWKKLNDSSAREDRSELESRFKSALARINSMLKVTSVAPGVATALSHMAAEKNVIRQASLSSSLAGFPGQERKIDFVAGKDSQFAPIKAQFDDLFVDRYFRHLDKFRVFFSFFAEKPMRSDTALGNVH